MPSSFARRSLFKAVGSAALLSGVVKKFSLSALAQPVTPPKRLIIFWTPNGVVQDTFWPTGSTGSNFELNTVMKPLQPHKSDLTIIKGVRFNGTGDHKTGAPFSTTARLYTAADAPDGPSIDNEISASLNMPSLVLCGQSKNENRRGYISYASDGSRVVPIREPQLAFTSVFGAVSSGNADGGTDPQKAYNRLVLEASMQDAQSLQARLPPKERVKMDEQLEALALLKKQYDESQGPIVSCASAKGTDFQIVGPDYQKRMELHSKLIAMAFACDKRRVVSFMAAPHGHDSMNFSFLGVNAGDVHNDVAHHWTETPALHDSMEKIAVWQAQQLANLVAQLKMIPEGNGTVFDNTVILWTSECATPNHGTDPIPLVLLGSAGKFFSTGRYLASNVPDNPSILMSLAHALGHKITKFGVGMNGPATMLHA
jgi:Protein of unknown function (DUF1552)